MLERAKSLLPRASRRQLERVFAGKIHTRPFRATDFLTGMSSSKKRENKLFKGEEDGEAPPSVAKPLSLLLVSTSLDDPERNENQS